MCVMEKLPLKPKDQCLIATAASHVTPTTTL